LNINDEEDGTSYISQQLTCINSLPWGHLNLDLSAAVEDVLIGILILIFCAEMGATLICHNL
jgi:hypothetical protein